MSDESRCLGNDGVVALWTPRIDDAARLIAGRDAAFRRWLGEGSDAPAPTACIRAGDVGGDGMRPVVGWIDYDTSPGWLRPAEANIGYNVFAQERGRGYATRALQLLMHHLAARADVHTGVLLIDPENRDSQAVASRARFLRDGVVRLRDDDVEGQWRFVRRVPGLEYAHEGVRIRVPRDSDLAARLTLSGRRRQRAGAPRCSSWKARSARLPR